METIMTGRGLVTVQSHIIEQQQLHPDATGEFSWLLSGITLATKIIESKVRRAGLADVLGDEGGMNVQGEVVQKLDRIANDTLLRTLGYRGNIGIMASEEDDEPHIVQEVGDEGRYMVLFDPLDGSSNIDVNVSVGTIFSVLRRKADKWDKNNPLSHLLQRGVEQVAAGYVVYGSSTVLAYTTGRGVHMFTLDPNIGAFVLHNENVVMPEEGKLYSVNEAYCANFPQSYQNYLGWAKQHDYSLRYIGSLVADFHRTLLRGGVFLYPPTTKAPQGKLRLLYEANPMAFLAEQAGGMASDGHQRILEVTPEALHQRVPLVIGSRGEVERVLSHVA
jgi:fructose-1,6-bisphosphatase I